MHLLKTARLVYSDPAVFRYLVAVNNSRYSPKSNESAYQYWALETWCGSA